MRSKLPSVGTTIFSEMSALAVKHMAINLSQGFPNFEPDERLRRLLVKHLDSGKNQYPPMAGVKSLREKIATKFNDLYDAKVDADKEITITAGGTQAIFTAIMAFVHAEDEVIVIEPAFDCYSPAIELVGANVVSYEMCGPDFKVQWDELSSLITTKTSMIIINTPHNPTGSILKEEDMQALEQITQDQDLLVLSDEVYEHLIFDEEKHASILKYPRLREKAIAVYSFGKTFHCTGWKVGYAVMPSELMTEFRKVHQFNVFAVNSFVQYGISDFLDHKDSYLGLPAFYQKKRDLLASYLEKSRFKVIPSKGSYFILCDYSRISELPDIEFAQWMTKEHGLACIPISVFYKSGKQENLVRFCFAKTDEVLREAGEVLLKV